MEKAKLVGTEITKVAARGLEWEEADQSGTRKFWSICFSTVVVTTTHLSKSTKK